MDWKTLTPRDGSDALKRLPATWWVAGGWALDLYLGTTTRAHKDLDVGIFRRDARRVLAALPDWECFEAKDGALSKLAAGHAPRVEVNSLWCKRCTCSQWELEFMLDEAKADSWIFRRDSRITRPLSIAIRRSSDGVPYLAPEIQLLYKARATRAQDQADFDRVVAHLEGAARTWLRESLSSIDSQHPWIPSLA